jgi:hypothetical protein
MSRMTMHRFTCLALVVAVGLAAAVGIAHAQGQNYGVPGDWLSSYLGARTAGIGGAFVASPDDATGVVWNPAGLSLLSQNEAMFESTVLYENTSVNALSFAVPNRKLPSFGLTILSLRSGDFERTNELNESLGQFSEGDMAFLLSASKSLTRRFTAGASLKVTRQGIDEFNAVGVGADLGFLYQLSDAVRVGASVLNIGGPTMTLRAVDETYLTEFRGGAAVSFLSGKALLSGEVGYRDGPGTQLRIGTEFWAHPNVALRAGYAESPAGGFSYRVTPVLRFDYAASSDELGVTHHFGLSYRFGGFFASSEADPPVFSPIGQQNVTKFNLQARTKADVQSWSLEIADKSNQVVRRFSGKGQPPAHVMWDGKDETGLPLPDGVYRYWLVVLDIEGREFTAAARDVEITTEGPKGSVPVFTSN